MKTATIDNEAFEVLVGAAVAMIAALEAGVPTTVGEEKTKGEKALADIRAGLEKAMKSLVVREQPKGFQQRLDEAIAAARARQ